METKTTEKQTAKAVARLSGYVMVTKQAKEKNSKYLTHAELKAQGFVFRHSYSWE